MAEGTGTLFVCGTPIGNLGDVTPRLSDTLAAVDAIACEDTRRTRQLLGALGIEGKRLYSHRLDNEASSAGGIVELLLDGADVALVSDAGMPVVSDPGTALVRAAHGRGIPVVVVPGPSAVESAVAVTGIGGSRYEFVGFFPRTSTQLRALLGQTGQTPIVAFESPHRLVQTLRVIGAEQPERTVAVCRELTKRFEQVRIGAAAELARDYSDLEPPRGEIVVVLDALPAATGTANAHAVDLARELVDEGMKVRTACRIAAHHVGGSSRELYEQLVR